MATKRSKQIIKGNNEIKPKQIRVQARAQLSKPRYAYTVSSIELAGTFTLSEAKKEYSRLRNIANKRLKRLAEAGYSDTDIYRANSDKYKPLKEFRSPRDLYNALSSLAYFIESKKSTVSGQREIEERIQQTLSEHFGTPEDMDLKKFGAFMEYMRDKYKGKEYDSERSAKIYRESLKKNISLAELKRHQKVFYDNEARLSKMKNRTKGMSRDRTAKEFAGALKQRGKKRGS